MNRRLTYNGRGFVCSEFLQVEVLDEICEEGNQRGTGRQRGRRLCYLCGRTTKLHMPGCASARRGGPSEEMRISHRLGPHVNVWDEQQLRCA